MVIMQDMLTLLLKRFNWLFIILLVSCSKEDMRLFSQSVQAEVDLRSDYIYPSWWDGTKIPVKYDNNGIYHNYNVTTNVSDLLQTTPYYVATDGDNSNSGLEENSPFATLQYAINQGAKFIYLLEGVYSDTNGHFTSPVSNDVAIIGIGNVSIEKTAISAFTVTASDGSYRIYMENLSHNKGIYFSGSTSNEVYVYLKNIRNLEPTSPDGIGGTNGIYGNSMWMILQNCESSNSNRDNFNYHDNIGKINFECIEIDCISSNPSNFDLNNNNQCSTAHNGMRMLRIGGTYLNGNAQVIADVNLDTQSILIGSTLNQQKDIRSGGDIILYTVEAEAFKCNLLGISAPLRLTASEGATMTLKDTYSEHTEISGNVVIE